MQTFKTLSVLLRGISHRWWFYPLISIVAATALPILMLLFAAIEVYPSLPSLDVLTNYHPQIPLRIYSSEGILIGEFGEEHRAVVKISEVPSLLKDAILAAEDERFYEHGGVDYMGMMRAAISDLASGHASQGASTITMQVARNFFLSNGKTLIRKFDEMLLASKIEHSLTKDEILQIYINQIYLGQRAYGYAAASQVYFGKSMNQLNVAEMAMLAGLPKAPSSYNPVANPRRAKLRQMYVLGRMHQLHYIDDNQFKNAQQYRIVTRHNSQEYQLKADYLAEMVRQEIYDRFKEAAYTQGIRVYTTIRQRDQSIAYNAVRKGVMEYDQRHGYRGIEDYYDFHDGDSNQKMDEVLQDISDNDDLIPAVVRQVSTYMVRAYCKGGHEIVISGEGLKFASRALAKNFVADRRIRPGAIIRVQNTGNSNWKIVQLPKVESAFVSANPQDGAIYSLVGGFDFNSNKFNHVSQAWRQPGSSFKPFIYSAALEKGFTPASIFDDAPLFFTAHETGSKAWQPKNYEGTFDGPMRMREGLIKSKNLVSIRILQAINPIYAQLYVTKFGFDMDKQPPYLTMALGAGLVAPMQMLTGYSVFANGGFRVTPYFIKRIEDSSGHVLSNAKPVTAQVDAPQIIDVRNAFTMVSMLQDVIFQGTGIQAMQLGRHDLAGKTGTTSDYLDAWFCGFQPTVVGISWIGFDNPRSLGAKETGAKAALPIWMDYMKDVLKNVPSAAYNMPDNMTSARIDTNGKLNPNGKLVEYFYTENLAIRPDTISTLNNKEIKESDEVPKPQSDAQN